MIAICYVNTKCVIAINSLISSYHCMTELIWAGKYATALLSRSHLVLKPMRFLYIVSEASWSQQNKHLSTNSSFTSSYESLHSPHWRQGQHTQPGGGLHGRRPASSGSSPWHWWWSTLWPLVTWRHTVYQALVVVDIMAVTWHHTVYWDDNV